MKISNLLLSISICTLFFQSAIAASSATPDRLVSDSKPAAIAPDSPLSTLKRAMSAGEVRKIMGAPADIKPMKAPNGKAEIWVYRREFNERIERVQVGAVPITTTSYGTDGKPYTQTIGEDIKFADVHLVTEETSELLMFNDHFLTGKISRREVKHYTPSG